MIGVKGGLKYSYQIEKPPRLNGVVVFLLISVCEFLSEIFKKKF